MLNHERYDPVKKEDADVFTPIMAMKCKQFWHIELDFDTMYNQFDARWYGDAEGFNAYECEYEEHMPAFMGFDED